MSDLVAEANETHYKNPHSSHDLCWGCRRDWPCLPARLAAELAAAREALLLIRSAVDPTALGVFQASRDVLRFSAEIQKIADAALAAGRAPSEGE